jgi:putative transposase
VWSYDFIEDRTAKGGRLRILSVMDEYHRECLTLRAEPSFSARKVIETLRLLFLLRGRPEHLKSDNGPEFIAKAVRQWLREQGVGPIYIEPGSPWQNGTVESFHATFRQECLNAEVFANGREARQVIEDWRDYYNNERLHSSLGYKTPVEFAAQFNKPTELVLSS